MDRSGFDLGAHQRSIGTRLGALLPLAQGLTVLVVDDDDFVRDSTRLLLEDLGARVLTAPDGANALDQLAAHTPDVVLSDLVMPGMDGYQLVARVRSDPARASLPIIAVSAFTSPADRERTRQAGFDAHLGKPFDYVDLAVAFTVVMRRRRELLARQLSRLRAFAKEERRKARDLQQWSRFARERISALGSPVNGPACQRSPSVLPLAGRLRSGVDSSMADSTSPVAMCPVCCKPLAELPAVLRQGDQYVHAPCWTGEEPAEKATAAVELRTEQAQGGDRAA